MELHERNAASDDYGLFLSFFETLNVGHSPPSRGLWDSHLSRSSFFLETSAGVAVAYAMCSAFGEHGDVRQIAVAPEWRGRGIGRRLMAAVAKRLVGAGCKRWALEVLEDNAAAIALYRGVGLRPTRRQLVLSANEQTLHAMERGRSRTAVVSPALENDDILTERALDLPSGQLARMRALRPGVRILSLAEPEAPDAGPHGLLRWLPNMGKGLGVLQPFIARSAEEAGALIHALFAVAPEVTQCRVELTVESATVAQALESHGAELRERLWVMEGPLPGAEPT